MNLPSDVWLLILNLLPNASVLSFSFVSKQAYKLAKRAWSKPKNQLYYQSFRQSHDNHDIWQCCLTTETLLYYQFFTLLTYGETFDQHFRQFIANWRFDISFIQSLCIESAKHGKLNFYRRARATFDYHSLPLASRLPPIKEISCQCFLAYAHYIKQWPKILTKFMTKQEGFHLYLCHRAACPSFEIEGQKISHLTFSRRVYYRWPTRDRPRKLFDLTLLPTSDHCLNRLQMENMVLAIVPSDVEK